MVNPNKEYDSPVYYDVDKWQKWADNLSDLFDVLTENTKIAFFIGENEKTYVLLKKVSKSMDVEVSYNKGITMTAADVFFTITKEDALVMLNNSEDSEIFLNFVKEEKLGIFSLANPDELALKGVSVLFSRLGLGVEQECESCSVDES